MTKISNPVLWADAPDNDVIRVGNAYYMVSTSMHSMPGGPIMKSYDLQNWTIVSYVFDRISDKDANNLENGAHIYGKGSWAASLRQVGEWFYCMFNSNDDHCAYMMRTRNIESSNWEKHRMSRFMHDPSILVDDDGRKYVIYGNGDIYITELTDDLLDVKEGGVDRLLFSSDRENIMLKAEGCHAYKIAGKYYAIFIEWPSDGHRRRREVCYRFDSLDGPFEHRVILDDDMEYHNAGVAQGAIFTLPEDSQNVNNGCMRIDGEDIPMTNGPDGNLWAAMMFQDHGAVGRIPYVLPVEWQDGWPMLGIDGFVPEKFELPIDVTECARAVRTEGNVLMAGDIAVNDLAHGIIESADGYGIVASDDFKRARGQEESLADTQHLWQWNHNPDNTAWSLSERKGYLRLTNMHLNDMGVLQARNTLTQRTFGPRSTYTTHLDLAGLKPGDSAGMIAIQGQFGTIGIRVDDDNAFTLVMCVNDGKYGEKVAAWEQLPEDRTDVYFKIEFDFEDNRDIAIFYRSLDGKRWKQIGKPLQMRFTLDHFMGYRVGLYSYATEKTGGYADFEYFSVN